MGNCASGGNCASESVPQSGAYDNRYRYLMARGGADGTAVEGGADRSSKGNPTAGTTAASSVVSIGDVQASSHTDGTVVKLLRSRTTSTDGSSLLIDISNTMHQNNSPHGTLEASRRSQASQSFLLSVPKKGRGVLALAHRRARKLLDLLPANHPDRFLIEAAAASFAKEEDALTMFEDAKRLPGTAELMEDLLDAPSVVLVRARAMSVIRRLDALAAPAEPVPKRQSIASHRTVPTPTDAAAADDGAATPIVRQKSPPGGHTTTIVARHTMPNSKRGSDAMSQDTPPLGELHPGADAASDDSGSEKRQQRRVSERSETLSCRSTSFESRSDSLEESEGGRARHMDSVASNSAARALGETIEPAEFHSGCDAGLLRRAPTMGAIQMLARQIPEDAMMASIPSITNPPFLPGQVPEPDSEMP